MQWYREAYYDYKRNQEFRENFHTWQTWKKVAFTATIFLIPLHPIGMAFWLGVHYLLK